ncbi:MAG: hypothetical protein U0T82_06410 [Bacteroidales bacterium]
MLTKVGAITMKSFGIPVIIGSVIFFLSCGKEEESSLPRKFITGIQMQEIVQLHAPEFMFVSRRSYYTMGFQYEFKRPSDSAYLVVSAAGYKTEAQADTLAKAYMYNISAPFREGSGLDFRLGDKFWFSGNRDMNYFYALLFIRKNVLVLIYTGYPYENVMPLAMKIDEELKNGSPRVRFSDYPLLPVIYSVTATKTVLKEDESTYITVHATDPYNEPLYYHSGETNHYDALPENVFLKSANRSSFRDPFTGKHQLSFWVINDLNMVSETAIFEIEIIN